jgi:hypothetical protein
MAWPRKSVIAAVGKRPLLGDLQPGFRAVVFGLQLNHRQRRRDLPIVEMHDGGIDEPLVQDCAAIDVGLSRRDAYKGFSAVDAKMPRLAS